MTSLMSGCAGCRKIDPDRVERIITAVLANIENWEERVMEMVECAHPTTGNKARGLSLARDLQMTRHSLRRLAGIAPP